MRRTAEVLIAEIGVDMNALPTSKDLASWASVCPGNDESAGKRRSGTTRKGEKVAGLSSLDGPGLIPPAAASSSGRDPGRGR